MSGKSKYSTHNFRPGHAPTKSPGHQSLRHGRVSMPAHIYNITSVTVSRTAFFSDFRVACAVARCFENSKLLANATILAWVLMPDHVHFLIRIGDQDRLDTVVNRLKSASARQANRVLGRSGALWQPAYHDHALRADEEVITVARYIIANPVRAGLVQRAGEYSFWNVVWL